MQAHPQYRVTNLDADTTSILSFYRRLIALRKSRPELVQGTYEPFSAQGDLLLYRRKVDGQSVTVNLGAEPASIASATIGFGRKVLLSTFLDRNGEHIDGVLDLRSNEGVIIGDDH
jgi:alpha-glucosidase